MIGTRSKVRFGTSIATFAMTFTATSVAAQGVSISAYGEYEHLRSNGDGESAFSGGLSFSSEPGTGGFGGLGLDASVRLIRFNDDTFYTIYLAPSIALGPAGKLSFGAPEPVLNGLYDGPVLGGMQQLDPLLRPLTGGLTDSAYFSGVINVPLGLRYDGTLGPVKVGASLHRLNDVSATTLELMARYPVGKLSFAGGIEVVNDSGTTKSRIVLGGSADAGMWGGGLYYYGESLVTGQSGLRGFVTYEPTERVDLNGTVVTASGGDYLLGLSMDYSFGTFGFAQIGVADGNSSSAAYDVSVGFRF
jgi:hypothetical protein